MFRRVDCFEQNGRLKNRPDIIRYSDKRTATFGVACQESYADGASGTVFAHLSASNQFVTLGDYHDSEANQTKRSERCQGETR